MFNHVKSLVWLLFSVSSFLAATLFTLDIGAEQNVAYDAVAEQLHGVRRSVYAHEGGMLARDTAAGIRDDNLLELASETFSGNEILHRLPDWIDLGVIVVVDGEILNDTPTSPLQDVLEQSRKRALQVLNLRIDYQTQHVYDSKGKEIRIIFSRK
ncbi:MAG: hypothetical protein E6Y08_20430 [Paenibacillus sp.]|uniref:hypothetical protein n=1 Tax=Paenibacillus sp. TaxID=58172 RepID=UPI002914EC99|nr:hypothetical protein [Paenibacillus sp.]MDU4698182.1 hypothetical protein [Paenibacillus sp.]